jgi:hypothetical protein
VTSQPPRAIAPRVVGGMLGGKIWLCPENDCPVPEEEGLETDREIVDFYAYLSRCSSNGTFRWRESPPGKRPGPIIDK